MPTLSHKSAAMPSSPIRKLVPFSEKARRLGRTVFHLNIGQPDIATPEVALNQISNHGLSVIGYSHSAGFETYREGLAQYYTKCGFNIDPEEVMVTTGGSEALVIGFQTCFNPGDEVIIPEPFYANYNGFAESCGLKIVPVTSSIEDGFSLPSIAEFEKKITDKTRGILICNPGNPTGYLYSEEELNQLRDIVAKNDLFLFADEVYREFCYDGAKPFSCMQLEGIDDNVILIDSVSKRYSMCGARVGALVSKNKQFMEAAMKFAQARLSPPTLGQIAGEAALKTPQSYFDEVIEEYVERRNILVDGLNSIEGVFCPMPKGAFYAIARLPVDNSDAFCQWILDEFEHDNQTVMMAPATGFYATPGRGLNEVRLAYVLERESLKKAVEVLRHALAAYPGRTN